MGKTIRDGRNDRRNTPKGQRKRKRKGTRRQMRNMLREVEKLAEAEPFISGRLDPDAIAP